MDLKMKRTTMLVAQALACFAMAGCGGGGSGSEQDTAAVSVDTGMDRAQAVSLVTAVPAGSFSTTFDGTENPISENGAWRRASNSWANVQKANGVAFGTSRGVNSHDDSYAILASSFGADQTAEGVVFRDQALSPGPAHEVELLLRMSDDAGNARGYECLFNWYGGVQIVRWATPHTFPLPRPAISARHLSRVTCSRQASSAT